MKDFYHSLKSNLFRLFTLAIVATFATSAKAAEYNLGELVLGQEYTLADFNTYTATLQSTVAGAYEIVEGSAGLLKFYTDEDHTNLISEGNGGYSDGKWATTITLEANTTYYLYSGFVWSGGTFKISSPEETTIEIARINHVDNSAYSIADGGRLDITFSTGVTFDNVAIATGSTTVGVTDYQISATNVMVNLGDVLKKWYANGTIVAEQQFTVTFSGLRSAADDTKLYNGDGQLVLTYYAAAQPTEMASATNADGSVTLTNGEVASVNFLSYFTPSNVNGKYLFTFSQAVDPTSGEVKLQYGSAEADDYYEETLTPTFNADNTVMTVDLSGKVRRAKDMTSSTYSQITLCITHIKGADGEYVATTTSGGVGSFYFTFPYVELSSTVAVDWGESESLSDELEIYVSNYADIEYDGIKFSWYVSGAQQTEVVALANLTIETDSDGGATITIPVPDAAKGISDVTVTFNNLYVADGLDHTSDLAKVFNPTLQILASTPAAGAEIETIARMSTVSVTLNRTDLGYVQYEIYDLNPDDPDEACVSSRATLTAVEGEEGVYTATRYGADLKCIKGHTYEFDVLGWAQESDARGTGYSNPAARASFTFSGATEVFTFSSVKFESIDPESGSTLTDASQSTFTLTFDGLVKVDSDNSFVNLGQGATAAFESVTPINGQGDYSKTWAVVVPESTMTTITDGLTLTIVAYDVDDKLVEGTEGAEENSYFSFTYKATFNNPDITFTPASGSTVKTLSSITAAYAEGIGRSWSGSITVYKGREFLAILTDENIQDGEYDDANQYSFILNLPEAQTEAGTYVVSIPEGFFVLGEYGNYQSKAYTLTYTIEAEDAPVSLNITTTPADGSTVTSCGAISIVFDDYEGAAPSWNGSKATITKEGGEAVELGEATYGDAYNEVYQPLGTAAQKNGKYTVTFPEGYFTVGDDGIDTPEFSISFTVKDLSQFNVVSSPANGETVEECDQIALTFPDYFSVGNASGKATISKDGGDAIELGDSTYDEELLNKLYQPLGGNAAEDGTYVVSFPEGYYYLAESESTTEPELSPAFTVTFTVESASDVITATPAIGAVLESYDGVDYVLTFPKNVKSIKTGSKAFRVYCDYDGEKTNLGAVTRPYYSSNEGNVLVISKPTSSSTVASLSKILNNANQLTTYYISFLEGAFTLTYEDGTTATSEAFETSFTITGRAVEASATPDEATPVESCNEIVIEITNPIEGATLSKPASDGPVATLYTPSGAQVELPDYTLDGNTINLGLNNLADEYGEYTIAFPEKYFWYTEAQTLGEGGVAAQAFYLSFTLQEENQPSADVPYTVSPDPNEALTELKSFTLTFEDVISGLNYAGLKNIGVSHDSDVTYYNSETDEFTYSGNSVTFTFGTAFTESGRYLVNIPASTIFLGEWGDVENTEIYIAFYVESGVVGPTKFNVVTVPADNEEVEECDQIELVFSDYAAADYSWSSKATIAKDGEDATELGDGSLDWDVYNKAYQPLNGAAEQPGKYVVTFPEGYFLLFPVEDNYDTFDESPEFTITFTVKETSGIEIIGVDSSADTRYFNLKGVEVKNPSAGAYIIVRGNKASKEVVK